MKTIHHLIILDASGSMASKVPEVLGGINQLIDEVVQEETNEKLQNRTTVVDFSSHTDFNVIYENAEPKDLKHITNVQYSARGMTALYDAIAKAFLLIPTGNTDVLVTIFTDGLENDSKEFKQTSIKTLIDSKKELGWNITYMGTSQEAMLEASRMGINGEYSLQYHNSKSGTMEVMQKMRSAREKYVLAKLEGKEVDDIFDKNNS